MPPRGSREPTWVAEPPYTATLANVPRTSAPSHVCHRLAQFGPGTVLTGVVPLLVGLVLPDCSRDDVSEASAGDASIGPLASSWPALGPAEPASPRRVGDIARGPGYSLSVDRLDSCTRTAVPSAARGWRRIGVEVSVQNSSTKPLRVNPFYAELRDADDHSYHFTLAGCEPHLMAGLIPPDTTWKGWLSFDVRANAEALELRYAPPDSRGLPETQVRFTLGDVADFPSSGGAETPP